jgi:hypothetical protein
LDSDVLMMNRHLFIAGTGRAGTSFLVRYLTELGLDTHLSRRGDDTVWFEDANAGLEDSPVQRNSEDLPYVLKSPWLYTCIDELLESGTFHPDAIIIPVRDLAEAAISRSVIERQAMHRSAPWMSEQASSWEDWAHTPGGVIFSMNPIDQGRLLAVGFHHLVQRLVAADIPIVFLAFPRFAHDADYLFEKLRPILPCDTLADAARAAHLRVADVSKVRVGAEIKQPQHAPALQVPGVMQYPPHTTLDGIGLKRELNRVRRNLADAQQETDRQIGQINALQQEVAEVRTQLSSAQSELAERTEQLQAQTAEQAEQRSTQCDVINQINTKFDAASAEREALQKRLEREVEKKQHMEEAMRAVLTSRSWRLTLPYRIAGDLWWRYFASRRTRIGSA